jgi:hypothetical protein
VVTLHARGDHLAPVSQLVLYAAKVLLARKSSLFTAIPVAGYGHCTFQQQEIMNAFGVLAAKVMGTAPAMVMAGGGEAVCIACRQ